MEQPKLIPETEQIIEQQPMIIEEKQPEISTAQPTQTCLKKDDGETCIPKENLIYNPNPVKKVKGSSIRALNRLIQPQIRRQPPGIRETEEERNKKGPLLQCSICKKDFQGKWSLNRHTNTVHRNLVIKPQSEVIAETVQPLPEDDLPMPEIKERKQQQQQQQMDEDPEFETWGASRLRKRLQSKQLPRPRKYVAEEAYESWQKP